MIAGLAGEWDRVFARRDALAAEIEEAFFAHPFGEIPASLPGIGPRTGARILAEIGDGSAFASGAKLAAYAGLARVTCQSGTSLNAETRSRRGAQRRPDLPGQTPLRRHTRHAPQPPAPASPAARRHATPARPDPPA